MVALELHFEVERFLEKIKTRKAIVGVIGLGYVGLPLATATALAGFNCIGFDIDQGKSTRLNAGDSYIDCVDSKTIARLLDACLFRATSDMSRLSECDIIIICVPTPLTRHREPDMTYIESTSRTIGRYLRPMQLVVLESTTYPGTTDEIVRPLLERNGMVSGRDFFIGFSPEREDPGNPHFGTVSIPKVVSGAGEFAQKLVSLYYSSVVERIVQVSTPAVAEAVKITENVFRAVNIALVNELKIIYSRMGIDVWEVIEAAKTKPFGYMPFYPGPGLGGHCIPIDPFYLTWKAREYEISTRFIELAGEINASMPAYVVRRLEEALDRKLGLSLGRARILIIGLAYKKNVSDVRESPSFKLIELIEGRGAVCEYSDPYVPVVPNTREHSALAGRASLEITPTSIARHDAVVIATDHDNFDYELIAREARLIVDARNAMERRGIFSNNLIKA